MFEVGDRAFISDEKDEDYGEEGIIGEVVVEKKVTFYRLDLRDGRSFYIGEEALGKRV